MKRKSTLVDSVSAEPEVSAVGRKRFSLTVIPQNKANRLRNVSSEPVYAAPLARRSQSSARRSQSPTRRRATFNSSLLTAFAVLLCLFFGGKAWGQTEYHSYTAISGTTGQSGEGVDKLLDNNTNTKWCQSAGAFSASNPAYVEFYSAAKITPKGYVLTTANDNSGYHGRNPKSWAIKAKVNSGDAWTVIEIQTNNNTMGDVNYTPYTFPLTNTTAYQYFRFEIYADQGGDYMQLSEFHFLTDGVTDNITALTVADGSRSDLYIPVYGYYAENYQHSQTIYPASMLTDLQGYSITKLIYYISSKASDSWGAAVFQVTLGTTTATEFANSSPVNALTLTNPTVVYTGSLVGTGETMVVNFLTPYQYTGGNLIIDVQEITKGTFKSASFYGNSENTYYSASGHDSNSVPISITPRTFMPKTTFVYSIPSATCNPSFSSTSDYITSFSLGSISNTNSGFSTGGYGDFTSMSTDLAAGATATASLTSSSGSGTHAAAVWIDFNNDGTFSSNERVGTQGSIGESTTVAISLSIPSNAAPGSHRLRVVYQYNVDATSISPCASASYGEGEDYTVNITPTSCITEIYTTADWEEFCNCVNSGHDYAGETVHLRANISINSQSNQAGSADKFFKGTFEGHGNTITVNMTATGKYCAPFYGIQNANINDLVVTGSITSNYESVGGICGVMYGNSSMTNCVSNVDITSNCTSDINDDNGRSTCGGFVGTSGGGDNPTFTGCAFTGSITARRNGIGGFIGFHASCSVWAGNYGGRSTFTNCFCTPTSINTNGITDNATFTSGYTAQYLIMTVSNSYYNEEAAKLNHKQGKQAYTVTGVSPVTVAMSGTPTTYDVSGITAYSNGIVYDGTIYGGDGDVLALSLSYEGLISGYTTSNGDLSGSSHTGVNDEYTLASLSGNAIINQTPCPFDNPPAGLIWKGGTDGDVTNWEIATNWAVYNESETRYQLAGSAPSESSNVFIIRNDACNIEGVPSLSSNKECNDITLAGIGVNIADGKYLTVNGTATFTSGIVSGNVTFGEGGSSAGANLNSYVDGTVTKSGNGSSFTFPTGSDGVLGTITATITSGESAVAKFNHKSSGFDQEHDGYPRWWNVADMCGAEPFNHVSNFEYWDFNTTADLSGVTFVSKASSADAHFHNPSEYPADDSDIIQIAVYDGCWKNIGGHLEMSDENKTITISEVNVSRGTTRSGSAITTFGSKDPSVVLPIELTSFTATCDGRSALVEWTTASERNNDYFSLERSDDAINFTEVARVAGAGNSIEPIDYAYTDYGIHGGDNYYRLVQVDYDGTRTVSEVIVANCIEPESDGEPEVLAYPNPFSSELTVVLDNFGNRAATIEVYDMLGKLIYTNKVAAPQNSYETILNLSNLSPAAYTVRVSTNDFVINRNVVKQ